MFNFDVITNDNNVRYNLKWLYIPDHLYKVLITEGSGSGKRNALLDLIIEQDELADKIFLYANNFNKSKYQLLNKNNPKKLKILIVFDDMVADILTNKKFQAIIKD